MENTLVLVNPGTSPARALRHIFPALGHFKIVPEKEFVNADDLIDFMDTESFTRVFFLNPYGNDHRLTLYQGIKQAKKRFICYDRGALNDSWFFDTNGFLGDSISYHRDRWDKPLSDLARERVAQWIAETRMSDETLEKNGSRIGRDHLKQSLNLGDRTILFVALQRPNDTATVHFAGPCRDAYTFNEWISNLAKKIDKRKYVIVVKKHPLEINRPNIDGVKFAPDEAHISDLIEISGKVIAINSGAGLNAITYGKPVICCGTSFYCHEGIAWQAQSPDNLVELAQADLAIDDEACLRFIKYLTQDFYSFGKTVYATRTSDGGNRIADKTLYSVIRGITKEEIRLGTAPSGTSLDAPLFYSFGGRNAIKKPTSIIPSSVKTASAIISASVVQKSPPARRSISLVRRPFVPLIRQAVRLMGNRHDDVAKFNADPSGYFTKLKNPFYRNIGGLLLGK